ncbi:MAG: hypothetical protein PHC41_08860 [Lachnospiraceae bacterium]|nr:hypothetical protein [Lachnospiraceae bacterium]MDD3616318.1 hypothetical protein [Lachnospiraceae bacterium]
MINNRRIHLMTQLTRYEEGEGSRMIPVSRYSRRDFIGVALIKNFFLISFAYVLILTLIIGSNLEYVIENLYNFNYVAIGALIIMGYIILLGVYSLIIYVYRASVYRRASNSVRNYTVQLKNLSKLYADEERKTTGGRRKREGR